MNNINDFFNALVYPLKAILSVLNSVTGSYAWAIFIFTVLINLAMFPLNVKQQKSMSKQMLLKPKLDALKEKYGDDKMKYNSEMQALYQREGINPAGGCLPLLIRLPILMAVYQIVVNLAKTKVNFMLFGINLSQKPVFNTDIIKYYNNIWLIPIFSFLTAFLSAYISMQQSKQSNPQAGSSMGIMMLMMPVMSLWFTFQVPGAVGFYWICSNIVVTAIQAVVNHYYSMDKIMAKSLLEKGSARRKKERDKISRENI